MDSFNISGRYVDIFRETIYPAVLTVRKGTIQEIKELPAHTSVTPGYLLPGFIDSHVHIESSMLVPSEFARLAVVHGTTGTISDPHEIANVCGLDGIDFMIRNGQSVPFRFLFGAPSCVPATTFETAGASLDAAMVEALLQRDDIGYLSEMMNFPGVLQGDATVLRKIKAAQMTGKPVDGHAPGLRGGDAARYIQAGISTDHECYTAEEALEKLRLGMKVIIREGSAARNFDALVHLLNDHAGQMMFCSDDKHPDSLVQGHIDRLCVRAVKAGIPVMKVLQAACVNPVLHYHLRAGLLRKGDPADFIRVNDLEDFKVIETRINGRLVADNGKTLLHPSNPQHAGSINHFACNPIALQDLTYRIEDIKLLHGQLRVIGAADGQLVTSALLEKPTIKNDNYISDPANDVLKIVVVNRYKPAPLSKGFIKNMGLKRGAIASSVAHDSHNIVAVGADDDSLCQAINLVINARGGIALAANGIEAVLPLPVAGLMSPLDGYEVAASYTRLDMLAKELGSTLQAPFMTLSFMALLVIPSLKMSDLGLFDGDNFRLISN